MRRSFQLALVFLVLIGCNSSEGPPPPVVTVSVDGKPEGYIRTQLYAESGEIAATGVTDRDGKIALLRGDGLPLAPGSYKVVVTDTGEEDEEDPMATKVAKARPKSRVAKSYNKLATTPATVTIEAGKLDYQLDIAGK